MIHLQKFIYSPGGEQEGGNDKPGNAEEQKNSDAQNPEKTADGKEHKTVLQKIKDALQDWSDKDEQDQEFDDTRV